MAHLLDPVEGSAFAVPPSALNRSTINSPWGNALRVDGIATTTLRMVALVRPLPDPYGSADEIASRCESFGATGRTVAAERGWQWLTIEKLISHADGDRLQAQAERFAEDARSLFDGSLFDRALLGCDDAQTCRRTGTVELTFAT